MKTFSVILAAAAVTFGFPTATANAGTLRSALPALGALIQSAAEAAVHAEAAESAPELEPGVRLPAPVTVRLGHYQIRLPELCRGADGRYDVLVHFHGVPSKVEKAFTESGVSAVLVTGNMGIGSGKYEDAFTAGGSLEQLLVRVDEVVGKHCEGVERGWRRVALSAWSAGYGAIYRVLDNKDAELVDAVLLADGLHVGFKDKQKRELNEHQMAPFDAFAEKAARGDKLFVISHSSITTTYASTTETASYLIERRGLERQATDEAGPLPSMHLSSKASLNGFQVLGFDGKDTDAHCDHLYAIGQTLYSRLAERWSK